MIRRLFWLTFIVVAVLVVTGKFDRSATTCTATITVDGAAQEVPCK